MRNRWIAHGDEGIAFLCFLWAIVMEARLMFGCPGPTSGRALTSSFLAHGRTIILIIFNHYHRFYLLSLQSIIPLVHLVTTSTIFNSTLGIY